jgi:hypothetical protein
VVVPTYEVAMPELDVLLEEELEDAEVLRKRGYKAEAELIERLVQRVHRATEDFLTWDT